MRLASNASSSSPSAATLSDFIGVTSASIYRIGCRLPAPDTHNYARLGLTSRSVGRRRCRLPDPPANQCPAPRFIYLPSPHPPHEGRVRERHKRVVR